MKNNYLILILCVALFVSGCSKSGSNTNPYKETSLTDFYFDTVISITIYDGNTEKSFSELIEICFDKCSYYEQLMSKTIQDSDTSKINNSKGSTITISDEESELISTSLYYSSLTKGKFDITISPLSTLWDFGENKGVPSSDSINNALDIVDYTTISLQDNQITLNNPSSSIDLGGIAKGYIADKLKKYLISEGITSAIINLGGNVLTIGCKPDGNSFKIGITKPFSNGEYSAIVTTKDKSVVTSGVYERYFYENENLYHHILDPDTGYPCNNGLYSATIISNESVDGDALSTGCFILGLDEGLKLVNTLDDIEAIFIDENYELHLSNGLTIDENNTITIAN